MSETVNADNNAQSYNRILVAEASGLSPNLHWNIDTETYTLGDEIVNGVPNADYQWLINDIQHELEQHDADTLSVGDAEILSRRFAETVEIAVDEAMLDASDTAPLLMRDRVIRAPRQYVETTFKEIAEDVVDNEQFDVICNTRVLDAEYEAKIQ